MTAVVGEQANGAQLLTYFITVRQCPTGTNNPICVGGDPEKIGQTIRSAQTAIATASPASSLSFAKLTRYTPARNRSVPGTRGEPAGESNGRAAIRGRPHKATATALQCELKNGKALGSGRQK